MSHAAKPRIMRRRFLFQALSAAVLLAAGTARGQTTSTSGSTTTTTAPSITATQQAFPERWLHYGQSNAQDLGQSTRPAGLNPNGINYADCISDMTLVYSVFLSGFSGQDDVKIFASTTGDCTNDTNRGTGSTGATCWKVNEGISSEISQTGTSVQFPVRVQNLVGPQQAPPPNGVLVNEGPSACQSQIGYGSVSFTVWILPLTRGVSAFDTSATAFKQTISVDLVGPPAPQGVTLGAGDTLLTAGWTPNSDSDTAGYDVFIDPPPGMSPSASVETICPDATASASSASSSASTSLDSGADADAADALGADAEASDATVAPDAGASASSSTSTSTGSAACYTINVGAGGGGVGSCQSTVLGNSIVQDGGASAGTATATDDAGTDTSESGTTSSASSSSSNGVGGISFIPCAYALSVNCAASQPAYTATTTTIFGETNGSYTIGGLTNNVNYNVAIAAVDSSGNVGPASTAQCDYPAPVSDFWSIYRDAGGQAGGGFCGIGGGRKLDESTGAPVGAPLALSAGFAAALAYGRRRRRRSK